MTDIDRVCASYVPTNPDPKLLHRWICDLCPTFRIGLTLDPQGQRLAFARLDYRDPKTRSRTVADFEARGENAEEEIILRATSRLRSWLGLPSGEASQARASEAAIGQARAQGDHATAEFLEQQLIKQRTSK